MRRTFVGETQSTTTLNAAPDSQRADREHEILVLAAAQMLRLGGDGRDRRIGQPAHEVDVVRGQILDDADVLDASRERPAANRRDGEQPADLAVEQPPAQLLQRGVEPLDVTDAAGHARGGADLDDPPGRVARRRERLLDQHRHPRRGELLGDRDVRTRSGRRRSRSQADPAASSSADRLEHEPGSCTAR